MVRIIHLNTLLGIPMMLLDHYYIYLFHKQLATLINLKKNKITMSLMIRDTQFLKSYNKIWEKILKLMKIDFNSKTTYGDDDGKIHKNENKNI